MQHKRRCLYPKEKIYETKEDVAKLTRLCFPKKCKELETKLAKQ